MYLCTNSNSTNEKYGMKNEIAAYGRQLPFTTPASDLRIATYRPTGLLHERPSGTLCYFNNSGHSYPRDWIALFARKQFVRSLGRIWRHLIKPGGFCLPSHKINFPTHFLVRDVRDAEWVRVLRRVVDLSARDLNSSRPRDRSVKNSEISLIISPRHYIQRGNGRIYTWK